MPQMSPMPWMLLMLMIFITLMITSSTLYFLNQKYLTHSKKINLKKFNLKW